MYNNKRKQKLIPYPTNVLKRSRLPTGLYLVIGFEPEVLECESRTRWMSKSEQTNWYTELGQYTLLEQWTGSLDPLKPPGLSDLDEGRNRGGSECVQSVTVHESFQKTLI